MGRIKVFFISFTLTTAFLAYRISHLLGNDPVPDIKDEFWGPGSKPGVIPTQKEDETIYPFKVDFTNPGMIKDLKNRLKTELDAGFTPPLEGIGFEYGFNTKYLKTVLKHWSENYDFAKREKHLNTYPHFKTKIGGMNIHFQHIKPTKKNAYNKTVPIILVHGWPGSFVEHQKIISYLLEPKNSGVNFEVVIPSLPGYGFSEGSSRPGLRCVEIANILGRLMKRLGYEKYYTLGEDWGTVIASDIAILYPDRVKGVHCSCFTLHPTDYLMQTLASIYSPQVFHHPTRIERYLGIKALTLTIRETGYLHSQGTKPDSMGIALTHSPSGLAAYILEKFSIWTNFSKIGLEDGGLTDKFTMDELLDNVMVYWVSKSITTSMRLYSEMFNNWNTFRVPVLVPTACTLPLEEPIPVTEVGLQRKYPNIKQFSVTKEGGHFASYEVPHLISAEATRFVNDVENGKFPGNGNIGWRKVSELLSKIAGYAA